MLPYLGVAGLQQLTTIGVEPVKSRDTSGSHWAVSVLSGRGLQVWV